MDGKLDHQTKKPRNLDKPSIFKASRAFSILQKPAKNQQIFNLYVTHMSQISLNI